MRKNKFLIIPLIFIIFVSTCFTTMANSSEYYYDDKDITVSFSYDCELSYEKRQAIANILVYEKTSDNQASTYSWCWLTGHNLTSNTVTTIEHKVDVLEPRCLKRVYLVETCSKCDYINETLVSTTYVACCPED